jgi:hypothetical protein
MWSAPVGPDPLPMLLIGRDVGLELADELVNASADVTVALFNRTEAPPLFGIDRKGMMRRMDPAVSHLPSSWTSSSLSSSSGSSSLLNASADVTVALFNRTEAPPLFGIDRKGMMRRMDPAVSRRQAGRGREGDGFRTLPSSHASSSSSVSSSLLFQ